MSSQDSVLTAPPDVSRSDWFADYPPPRSLPLDQEALRIYEHAYALGLSAEKEGTPPVTFTTVLAALLVGQDDTSRWFAQAAREYGPEAESVFNEKGLDRDRVAALSLPPGRPESVRLSKDKQLLTTSARSVIEKAEQWAQQVGGSDIGVRHLVASYVLNPPPAHGAQMRRWNYQETKWRSAFFAWTAQRYTAEQWTDASHRPAPTRAARAFEQQQPVTGEELAFPGDERTLAVLEKAAAYHARGTDPFLRLHTVFCGLIETARDDHALQDVIRPVWNAYQVAAAQYQHARDRFFPAPAPEEPALHFSGLNISSRVLNVLETARDLALATRHDMDGEFRVGVEHIAGALVARRVDGDVEIATLGFQSLELRLALIEHVEQQGGSGDVWRESLGVEEIVLAGRPVDLNSDEPEAVIRLDREWTDDPLRIRRDVETFAALLASRSLEPPLSIGLFGPWGSGKTTFLKRLRRAVDRLAAGARETRDESGPALFVSNVVHVDFNAWHFAEGALTSSLVDTILRELSDYIKGADPAAGKAWLDEKLAALASTTRTVEAATAVEETARDAVADAETRLATSRKEAADAATGLMAVVEGVWTATKAALEESSVVKESGVLATVGDTIDSTEELRARLTAVRERPMPILSDLGWARSLLFAVLLLGMPPVIAWLVGSLLAADQSVQLLSSVTATISVIALWARAATGAVSKVDRALNEVAGAYAKRLAEDRRVVDATAALDAAQTRAATAAAGLQAARDELARARVEAANATLPAQMLQLASSRIDAQTYNSELTTLSLARADLEALSVILRDQRTSTAADGMKPSPSGDVAPIRPVDRVILYIDDLDRCKPRDVVRVLQLVHMLLAFELFVVVVAVDARWVEEALTQSFTWLGDNGAAVDQVAASAEGRARHGGTPRVTPQDYLEKIFQIAFWLEPMTAPRAAEYLGSLVPAAARESGPVFGSGFPSEPPADEAEAAAAITKVGIAGVEMDFMRALAAYVGSSPRRVKRLVNAYRLIKARLSDAQIRTFLTSREEEGRHRAGPYQLVIGLLVIGTGAPASSAHIMKELAEWDPGDGLDRVVDRFRARGRPEWTMAARVIETLMQTHRAKDVSELRGWARVVRRFLLTNPIAPDQVGGLETSWRAALRRTHSNGTDNMADVTISDTKTYTIIPGQPVELNIVIGDKQAGGTSLMLDGRQWEPTQEWEPVGAAGDDLRFKVLHCVTTVRDINELSNHTSVTYTLRGGVHQQPFPYSADVADNGVARYIIDFVFVT